MPIATSNQIWSQSTVPTAQPQDYSESHHPSTPLIDYQLIPVNITSSSPPDSQNRGQTQTSPTPILGNNHIIKNSITRANSAKCHINQNSSSGQEPFKNNHSRKSSTITFQTPEPIKRPNSTIGILSSAIPSSQSLYSNFTDNHHCAYNQLDSNNSSNYNLTNSKITPITTIETPESDILAVDFNPVAREKAASLTLPDPKLHLLRKGCSNPFLTTNSSGQYHLPPQRTSIILNGNILHSISPIPPGRPPAPTGSISHQLSVHVQDGTNLSGSVNFADTRQLSSTLKARGSSMSSNSHPRSSYIGDEEHFRLHQQYLATGGRKDTIISIGKNFQIQFKSPSTSGLAWRYRTCLEKFLLFLLAAILLVSLIYIYQPIFPEDNSMKICTSMECVKTAGSLLSAMDLNADPCEDFFQYACGTWVKKHVISEDRSSSSTFEVMADDLQVILKDLLEKKEDKDKENTATNKARKFYRSCMNVREIELIGDAPVRRALEMIGEWPILNQNWDQNKIRYMNRTTNIAETHSILQIKPADRKYMEFTIENLLGKIRGDFNQAIIVEQYVGPDDRNSSNNIIQFDQTSLGLPSRENFLQQSEIKDSYLELMVDIAELVGADRKYARQQMENVLDFETQLANVSMPEVDRHDTNAIYNKMTIEEMQTLIPQFNWLAYLNSFMPVEIKPTDEVVLYSINYYKKMGQILNHTMNTDKRIVINYVFWRLMKSFLPILDGEYGVRRGKFRKVLLGISADRTRWSQCIELVNKKMGMAVGALFIRDNFDPKSKEIAIEMIRNIRQAFNELLNYNDWMDDETRQKAKEKADAINERIGYPELLTSSIQLSKEYHLLEVEDSTFLENIMNVFRFESHKNLIKLGTKMDKDSWTTDPAVVNAFYSPNKNEIVFPAGILQPLFYSQYFPKSLNYGGIGVVIGHEITHGFDDRGRQFDKDGNMKLWWNNATIERFKHQAQCIVDQYSSYVLKEIDKNVDGEITKGENIADNGGLKQSYRAFKKWENINGVEPRLPGLNLTHDQLFFLNYAQIWCGSMRPEDARNKIKTAVHSPGPIRILGPLSNSYDFSRAYDCPLGSRMNPTKKCSVW